MSFRLQKYIHQICDHHLKENKGAKELPLVFPLVVYNGPKKYSKPRRLLDLYREDMRDLAEKNILGEFALMDLTEIDNRSLKGSLYSGFMLSLMKNIRSRDIVELLEGYREILKKISMLDLAFTTASLCYILGGKEESQYEDILEIFKESVSEEARGEIMTIAERMVEEGIQKGMQKGREEGIQKGIVQGVFKTAKNMLALGSDIEFVSKVTGLPTSEIRKLK